MRSLIDLIKENDSTQTHLEKIEKFIKDNKEQVNFQKEQVNFQDDQGNTALHYACNRPDSLDLIEKLLEHGALLLTNKEDKSAIDYAIQSKHYENLFPLMAYGKLDKKLDKKHVQKIMNIENFSDIDSTYGNAVCLACRYGLLGFLRWLVEEKGMSLEVLDEEVDDIVLIATWGGHLDILKWLVEKKEMPLSVVDEDGDNPVILAVLKGHLHILKWLVEKKGMSLEVVDMDGDDPVILAALKGHLDILRWLLKERHMTLDVTNSSNKTPLESAGSDTIRKYIFRKQCEKFVGSNKATLLIKYANGVITEYPILKSVLIEIYINYMKGLTAIGAQDEMNQLIDELNELESFQGFRHGGVAWLSAGNVELAYKNYQSILDSETANPDDKAYAAYQITNMILTGDVDFQVTGSLETVDATIDLDTKIDKEKVLCKRAILAYPYAHQAGRWKKDLLRICDKYLSSNPDAGLLGSSDVVWSERGTQCMIEYHSDLNAIQKDIFIKQPLLTLEYKEKQLTEAHKRIASLERELRDARAGKESKGKAVERAKVSVPLFS